MIKFRTNQVHGAGVVVDTSLAFVAVPVAAEPVHVQVEGGRGVLASLDFRPEKAKQTNMSYYLISTDITNARSSRYQNMWLFPYF